MHTPARTILYGLAEDATVRIENVRFYEQEGRVAGMRGDAFCEGERGEAVVKGSVGATQLLPVAAALAAAFAFAIPLPEALAALDEYEPPPGRCRLLKGRNGSIIIDDSYNSSPAAVEEALATLKVFPRAKRRIAVLGDMLELGRYSVLEHERLAPIVGDAADVIVPVGIRARAFATVPGKAEVIVFENSRVVGPALAKMLKAGDVILVKGSQSIRMERIVETILANPIDTAHIVRQEEEWKRKP